MTNKSTIWNKIFYFGWIPIVALIILIKFFMLNNPAALASTYVNKNKDLINSEFGNFKFLSIRSSGKYIFTEIQLLNDVYLFKNEKEELAEKLFTSVKNGTTCKTDESLNLLEKGVIFVYTYYDKQKKEITDITIDKKFCE
jgi:hypothetical protein